MATALLLAWTSSNAQSEFSHIDWSKYEVGETLPEYCQSVELGQDYSAWDYSVKIEYPELQEATKAETIGFAPFADEIADSIRVTTHLGVSRKVGMLDICVLPIMKKDGKYFKLLSCKIVVCKTPKAAKSPAFASEDAPRYKAHSVLNKGRWVKIRVADEGIYQMSKSYLAGLGFNNINKVKVYGYGGRVQNHIISYGSYTNNDFDDLEEVPLYRRTDAVLFFAEGTVRWSNWSLSSPSNPNGACGATHTNNPYSKYSYYFVTEGDEPMVMPVLDEVQQTSQVLTTYPEHTVIENDAFSWYTGGRTFFDSYNFANGNSQNYVINTPDVDNNFTTQVTVSFSANSTSVTNAKVTMGTVNLGTINLGAVTSEYDKATTATRSFETNSMLNTNTLNITTTAGHAARLDYIRVCYRRKLKLNSDFLVFSHNISLPSKFILTGAKPTVQIWRLGYPGNPVAMVKSYIEGNDMAFNVSNPTLRYVAVDVNASYPAPEKVGIVANQDLHADSVFDMVIIIPESGKLLEQAQRIADIHTKHDSLRVKIVRADQLYNEFSSGTPDGGAYRRYMKMLYDRNTGVDIPKYLLFFGGCLWDNRGVTPACSRENLSDYLLSYESEPSVSEVSCYVNDDYFGMLDDGEGANLRYEKVDVGIGRFPVTKASEAKVLVDKTIDYINNKTQGGWKNAVYYLADDGDKNKHVREADEAARRTEEYYPNLNVGRIYWDAYARQITATGFTYPEVTSKIKNAMTKGALLMNYTGHGAPYCISKEMVLKVADFKEFSSNKIPMWVVASCEITPYDRQEENIGVESLINPNGASIAFLSSSRAVYSTQNSYINNYFMYYVFGRQNGKRNTIGDATRLAKVNLVSSVEGEILSNRDYSDNKLKYALMGDPALTLSMPTENVVIDSINGISVASDKQINLSAGSMARFSGHIESSVAKDNIFSNFNGNVVVTLYDSKDTITCRNNQNEDITPFTYQSQERMLYECNDSVRNGRFTVTMPIPLDIKYSNANGLVRLYAVSTDGSLEANGKNQSFTIGGTSPSLNDSKKGPRMSVYLNNPDFKDGQTVNATPFFHAILNDSDGINITGNGVGHDLELIIDGHESTSYILNPYYTSDFGSYTSGTVSYMIPRLENGKHKLLFRAWDVKNNSSAVSLNFVVDNKIRPNITSVSLSKNPASTSTMFIINYDRPAVDTEFEINVYNTWGQLCWNHKEKATSANGYHTINWNLCSNNGVALASGLYVYQVIIKCDGSAEAVKKQKLIISRQ